ncbi:ATP-binding cassette domain-containing protein [Pseudoroseomonas wenyumeiae]
MHRGTGHGSRVLRRPAAHRQPRAAAPASGPLWGGTAMSLLEMHGLWKNYRRGGFFRRQPPLSVLRDAGLRIGVGECVALLGASGSGKSTLGRLLLGLETPDAGEVLFEGSPAGRARADAGADAQLHPGGVPGSPWRHQPALQRLRGGGGTVALCRPQRRATAGAGRGLAASVGLDPSELGRLAHRFSGGQLQRLCIARALAPPPAAAAG